MPHGGTFPERPCRMGAPGRVGDAASGNRFLPAIIPTDLRSRRGLPGWVSRTVPLEQFDHAIEIGIARAKFLHEPVPSAFGDALGCRDAS